MPKTMSVTGILVALQLLLLLLGHHARGSSVWSDDDDPADVYDRIDREPIHVLRHHQHTPEMDMVTQGPRAVRSGGHPDEQHGRHQSHAHQVRMRHHNQQQQHNRHATALTTTTIRPPSPPPPPEEHRLRHSQKMYKPYALIESREQDFGAADHRRRGGQQTAAASQHSSAAQRSSQVQLAQRSRQSPYPSIFNVTAAKQLRYFDRDALYAPIRRSGARWPSTAVPTVPSTTPSTTTTTTTTSTTTMAPTTVRMRHSGGSRQTARDRKAAAAAAAAAAVAANKKPFLNTYDRFDDPYFSNVGAAGTRDNEDRDRDNDDDGRDDDDSENDDDDDDDYDEEYDDDDGDDDGGRKSQPSVSNRLTSGGNKRSKASSVPSTRSMLKSVNSAATGYDDLDELDELDDGGRQDHGGRDQRYTDEDDTEAKSNIPGSLTEHKLRTLGTPQAATDSRRQYKINEARASEHIMRISAAAACRWPRLKVVPVQSDPSASKQYIPHCTLLHRCGDDTGCCSSESRTCVAKSQQTVDLYFFVSTTGSRQGTIEKQTFVNHTECHCVSRDQVRSTAAASASQLQPQELRRATVISCTCPTLFETVLQPDGTCRCDCSSGNVDCDWKKSGREHFPVMDRKCIGEGRCKLPTCEYGSYNKLSGRCPRKEEKFNSAFRH